MQFNYLDSNQNHAILMIGDVVDKVYKPVSGLKNRFDIMLFH